MGPILVRGQATLRQQLALSPRLQRLEQLHFLASVLNAGRKEESGALSLLPCEGLVCGKSMTIQTRFTAFLS